MANQTYRSSQIQRAIHATSAAGNGWSDDGAVTPTAVLQTTDAMVLLTIPAGVRLQGLRYRCGDFDTGTTLLVNLGYRSRHATPQLAPNPTYFLAASAGLQTTQGNWQEIPFPEITFNEPVDIVMVPSVNATGVSGTPTLFVQAQGAVVGAV